MNRVLRNPLILGEGVMYVSYIMTIDRGRIEKIGK